MTRRLAPRHMRLLYTSIYIYICIAQESPNWEFSSWIIRKNSESNHL
jgi:hypothetical protein